MIDVTNEARDIARRVERKVHNEMQAGRVPVRFYCPACPRPLHLHPDPMMVLCNEHAEPVESVEEQYGIPWRMILETAAIGASVLMLGYALFWL